MTSTSTPTATGSPLALPLRGASFRESVARFFKKYATFTGRASLSEYWWSAAFRFVVILALYIPLIALGISTSAPNPETGRNEPGAIIIPFAILLIAFILATLVPSYAILVRRLHDTNMSGWLVLLTFVPLGGIVLLIFALMGAKPEGARFDA